MKKEACFWKASAETVASQNIYTEICVNLKVTGERSYSEIPKKSMWKQHAEISAAKAESGNGLPSLGVSLFVALRMGFSMLRS